MRVSVMAGEERYLSIEMEDRKARRAFRILAEKLALYGDYDGGELEW